MTTYTIIDRRIADSGKPAALMHADLVRYGSLEDAARIANTTTDILLRSFQTRGKFVDDKFWIEPTKGVING